MEPARPGVLKIAELGEGPEIVVDSALPGAIVGLGRRAAELAPEILRALEVPEGYTGLVPLTMFVAIPMLDPGHWLGHTINSIREVMDAGPPAGARRLTVAIALSALCVGGTFMVITLLGVQEMRSRAPAQPARLVGRITAAFAAGQIAGPVVSSLLLQWPALGSRGLAVALQLGALTLFATAFWLWRRTVSPKLPRSNVHA